jgi:hypothetical protein
MVMTSIPGVGRAVKNIRVTARKSGREWSFGLPWDGRREEALAFLAGLRDEGAEIIVHDSIILERREDYVDSKR